LHLLHLLGIVVHQDEGFEAEIQLFGEGGEVAGFGIPVDALGHEIAGRERHLGMRAKGGGDILLVILAAQGEQHAFAAALDHELLERAARRVEDDALRGHPRRRCRPQGVVGNRARWF